MSEFLEKQRSACAFGSFYTALAIKDVLPLAHTGPGCAHEAQMILGFGNGGQVPSTFPEPIIPCTNFTESDVVFGGVEKLAETIKHSLKNFNTEMIMVFSGCTPAIVGDDVDEAVGRFADADIPVLAVEAAGFKGNNIYGHHQVLRTLIEKYVKPTNKIDEKQVNIWGIIPFQDPFWDGTYDAVERLLQSVGLRPNIIYGNRPGLENVRKIPSAKFNLVLSPWWDREIVELLKEKFNTPYFVYPNIPVGVIETTKFLRAIAAYAKLEEPLVNKAIQEGEDRYFYHFDRMVNWYYEFNLAPKKFYIIGNSPLVTGIAKCLVNELGLVPEKVYITDGVPEERCAEVSLEFKAFEGDLSAEVVFTTDGGLPEVQITQEVKENLLRQPPYILGSYWDAPWARAINAPFLPVSMPIGVRLIANKTYFGYDGALTLFEDFFSVFDK